MGASLSSLRREFPINLKSEANQMSGLPRYNL